MEPGKSLGRYEIVEPLGAGGMGEVYVAQDTQLGRKVAVKVLPEQFAQDAERLARFEQEARAAAALNHPHIAAVFDVGEEKDGEHPVHFMVQELLEGSSLRDFLGGERAALPKALDLAIEVCEALSAAHGAGIIHRDLKPDNIFVSKDGHAKVLDFGLAKLTELAALSSPDGVTRSPTMIGTVAGQVMGTAGYMAPEQVEGGEIDARADLFAFGVLLYEMTSGHQPFAGKNVIDTLHKITNLEPERLSELDEALPADLQRILDKALAKDAAARYQSAADIAVDLRGLAADVEADRAVSVAEAGSRRVAVEGFPAWALAAVAAAALTVGAVGSALWPGEPATVEAPLRVFDIDYAEGQQFMPCCFRYVELAPDASFLAYAVAVDNDRSLFVRPLDQYEASPVPGVDSPWGITTSPDGLWIAYVANSRNNQGMYKVALAGGAPFQLVSGRSGWDLSWGDDGNIYFGHSESAAIARVPQNGGEVEIIPLQDVEEGTLVQHVAVLPGSEAVAVGFNPRAGENGIAVVRLADGSLVRVADEGSDPRWLASGHLLYTRGGAAYARPFDAGALRPTGPAVPVIQGVQIDSSGTAQIAVAEDGTLAWQPGSAVGGGRRRTSRLDLLSPDGTAAPLNGRVEGFTTPQLSPDGARVAVTIFTGEETTTSDVWILEVAQGGISRLTVDGTADAPVWSPDGAWIYYTSERGGDHDIWRRASDFSGEPELVLEREGRQYATHVSPDGAALLFEESPAAGGFMNDLGWAPTDPGGEARLLAQQADFREYDGRFSPDGRFLLYVSNETGSAQVYLREVDGDRRWVVSPGYGSRPFWHGSEGRVIYYTRPANVMAVAIELGDTPVVGTPEPLTEYEAGLNGPFGVLEDGRMLMLRRAATVDDDGTAATPTGFNIVLNWFQELRRLAPPAAE